jgi:hypothetical protein
MCLGIPTLALAQRPAVIGSSIAILANGSSISCTVSLVTMFDNCLITVRAMNNEGTNRANPAIGPLGWAHHKHLNTSYGVVNLDISEKFVEDRDP